MLSKQSFNDNFLTLLTLEFNWNYFKVLENVYEIKISKRFLKLLLKIRSYVFRRVNDVSNNVCRHWHTNNSLEQRSQNNFIAWRVNENFVKSLKLTENIKNEFTTHSRIQPEISCRNSWKMNWSLWEKFLWSSLGDRRRGWSWQEQIFHFVFQFLFECGENRNCTYLLSCMYGNEDPSLVLRFVSIINKWNFITFRQFVQSQNMCTFFRNTQWTNLNHYPNCIFLSLVER